MSSGGWFISTKSPKHSLINRGEYPSCSWVTAIRTLGGQLLKTGHFTR
jgi:hypothetical protein